MQFRRRLRSRIVLSFLLFGTLLSALFALSTLFLQNYLEDQLIGATLKQELDDYVTQLRLDPSVIGGIKIQKGSTYYDFSIEGNLKKLREMLTEVSIPETLIQIGEGDANKG